MHRKEAAGAAVKQCFVSLAAWEEQSSALQAPATPGNVGRRLQASPGCLSLRDLRPKHQSVGTAASFGALLWL